MLHFKSIRRMVLVAAVLLAVSGSAQHAAGQQFSAGNPAWSGQGAYRLLARLPTRPLAVRQRDELPAELAIDFAAELRKLVLERTADIASLQVIDYDHETGQAKGGTSYAHAHGPFDGPFRWYDAA